MSYRAADATGKSSLQVILETKGTLAHDLIRGGGGGGSDGTLELLEQPEAAARERAKVEERHAVL